MSIAINSNPERDQYQAAAGQTVFNYSFPIFDETYIKVYQRAFDATPNDADDILTLGVDYTVTGVGEEAGGFITLNVAAAEDDIITLVGEEPIERESVFTDYNPFTVALNQQLNEQTVMQQQTYTYWDQVTPRYYFSELVSDQVRPLKRFLPMLNDGYIWIGRGDFGDNPDDIYAVAIGDFDALGILSADYVLGTANPALPNAQPLGGLGTGYLYNNDDGTTGVLSVIGAPEVDTAIDTVTQPGHGLAAQKWVYPTAGGLYAYARADDAVTANEVGVIIEIVDANTFKVQQSGKLDDLFAGLTVGGLYYLSATSAGDMTLVEPTDPGHYSKPVFQATTATDGWVLSHRKLSASDSDNPVVTTYTQAGHGFAEWDLIRKDIPTSTWMLADGSSAPNAECQGMVVGVPDADHFILQMIGKTPDSMPACPWASLGGGNFTDGEVYFLDPANPGEGTPTEPTVAGYVSKPVFVANGNNTGNIYHYRGELLTDSGGGGGDELITWVTFDASSGTPVIGDEENVTSITDNGVGMFGVNFTLNFANNLYTMAGMTGSLGILGVELSVTNMLITGCNIVTATDHAFFDLSFNDLMIRGLLA
jgi:hypothetical protein